MKFAVFVVPRGEERMQDVDAEALARTRNAKKGGKVIKEEGMVIVTKISAQRPVIRRVIGAGAMPIATRVVVMVAVTEPLGMVIMTAFVTAAGDNDTGSDYSTGSDDCDRGVMTVVIAWPVYCG